MKLKKLISIMLAGIMVFGLTACGGSSGGGSSSSGDGSQTASGGTGGSGGDKLVVWTLAKDLEQFAVHYIEQNPGVEIETVVIEPANYVTKVQTALNGGRRSRILSWASRRCLKIFMMQVILRI